MASKWELYYQHAQEDAAPLPWDSEKPSSQLLEFVASPLFKQLAQGEDARHALEIGCGTIAYLCNMSSPSPFSGTGASIIFLAEHGFFSTGVDVVPRAIDTCHQRAIELARDVRDRLTFVCADAWQLPSSSIQAESFDLIYDCQTFHVLRQQDEQKIVNIYHQLLRKNGVLFVMTGNDAEPASGPSTLSKLEIQQAFGNEQRWKILSLSTSRFDDTPTYQKLEKNPLAWVLVVQKI